MTDSKTEKIMAAAERLVLAHGLRATTMEAIAREAGVAKPTLYGRFPDKDAVFRAVVRHRFAALRETFAAALAGQGPAVERIATALAAKITAIDGMVGGSPHAAEILEANATIAGDEGEELFDWTRATIAAELAAAGMAPDAAQARAALVIAAVEGLKARGPMGEPLRESVEFVARRLLA